MKIKWKHASEQLILKLKLQKKTEYLDGIGPASLIELFARFIVISCLCHISSFYVL